MQSVTKQAVQGSAGSDTRRASSREGELSAPGVVQAESGWPFGGNATEGTWVPPRGRSGRPEETLSLHTSHTLTLAPGPAATADCAPTPCFICYWFRLLKLLPGYSPPETQGLVSAPPQPGWRDIRAANVTQLFPAGCSLVPKAGRASLSLSTSPVRKSFFCHRQGHQGWHLELGPGSPHRETWTSLLCPANV